jgi:hypothetical protein
MSGKKRGGSLAGTLGFLLLLLLLLLLRQFILQVVITGYRRNF